MSLSVEQRDDLLERMLPVAAQVVGSVRTRDTDHFTALTEPLDRTRLLALLVDVAAMVPDDRTVADLVRWTHSPTVTDEQYADVVTHSLRAGMKHCTGCQQWWRLEEFQRSASCKDGRRSQCRVCRAAATKKPTSADNEVAA
jgi:hypothetical protein